MVVYCLEQQCFKQDERSLPLCQSSNHRLLNQSQAQQLLKRTAVCQLLGEAFHLLRVDLINLLRRAEEEFGRKAGMSMSQQLCQRLRLQKKYELHLMQSGLATFLQKIQRLFECPLFQKIQERLPNIKLLRKRLAGSKPKGHSMSVHELSSFKIQKRPSLSLINNNIKLYNRPIIKKQKLLKQKRKVGHNQKSRQTPARKSVQIINSRVLSAGLDNSNLIASNLVQTRIFEIAKQSLKSMLLQPQKYIQLNRQQQTAIQKKAQRSKEVQAFVLPEEPVQQKRLSTSLPAPQLQQKNTNRLNSQKPSPQLDKPEIVVSQVINLNTDKPKLSKEQMQATLGRLNILTDPVRIGTTRLKSMHLDYMVFAVLYKTFYLLRSELKQPSLDQQNSKIQIAMKKILAKVQKDYRRQPLFQANSFRQVIPCVFPLLKQHWLELNRIAPRHPDKRLDIQEYLLALGTSLLIIHDNHPESRRYLFNQTEYLNLKSSLQKRSYIDKGLQGVQSQLNLIRLN